MDIVAIKFVESKFIPPTYKLIDVTWVESYDKKLAVAGLRLDQMIYFDNVNVDLVCVIKNANIDTQKMEMIAITLPKTCNTIYFANGDTSGSFFCRPHVLTLLSDVYKMKSGPANNGSIESHDQRLRYLMERINITFGKF
jgi:hypothetical protein